MVAESDTILRAARRIEQAIGGYPQVTVGAGSDGYKR
jgi:hypothetical protein